MATLGRFAVEKGNWPSKGSHRDHTKSAKTEFRRLTDPLRESTSESRRPAQIKSGRRRRSKKSKTRNSRRKPAQKRLQKRKLERSENPRKTDGPRPRSLDNGPNQDQGARARATARRARMKIRCGQTKFSACGQTKFYKNLHLPLSNIPRTPLHGPTSVTDDGEPT